MKMASPRANQGILVLTASAVGLSITVTPPAPPPVVAHPEYVCFVVTRPFCGAVKIVHGAARESTQTMYVYANIRVDNSATIKRVLYTRHAGRRMRVDGELTEWFKFSAAEMRLIVNTTRGEFAV